jgi:hypothetical protein
MLLRAPVSDSVHTNDANTLYFALRRFSLIYFGFRAIVKDKSAKLS